MLKKWNVVTIMLGVIFLLPLFAQQEDELLEIEGKREDPDMEALYQWIQDKRLVTVKELGGDLSLSSEVRVEMQATNEKKNGVRQRGRGAATDKPTCAFDIEVNIMLDYVTERTWASLKIEFDNDMGLVNGTTDRITLERAYIGGRMYNGITFVMDTEMGRQYLNDIFDSRIEYSALFDGIMFIFNKAFEKAGALSFKGGAFIVDDRKYHFGYIAEIAMLQIASTGLFTKYSFIDWKKYYRNPQKNLAFNFQISQFILGYQCTVSKWKKPLKLYAAGLVNHRAKKIALTNYKKANYAWYAGFSVGQILKKGDWAFDFNYQMVAPQAIPDFDNGGIKRGNAEGIGFYSEDPFGRGAPTTNATAVGSGNYKGWHMEFLYAVTSNFTIFNNFEISKNLYDSIGPKMKYLQYEIEFIYAF